MTYPCASSHRWYRKPSALTVASSGIDQGLTVRRASCSTAAACERSDGGLAWISRVESIEHTLGTGTTCGRKPRRDQISVHRRRFCILARANWKLRPRLVRRIVPADAAYPADRGRDRAPLSPGPDEDADSSRHRAGSDSSGLLRGDARH